MVRVGGYGCGAGVAPGVVRGGACPNLLQRRSGPGSAARKSAEYQRSPSRTPAGSGPLQQIWTNGAAAGFCADGGLGDHLGPGAGQARPGRRDVHFALESAVPTVVLECKTHISSAKRTSRGRNAPLDEHRIDPPPTISDGPRPHRPAPVPVRGPRLPARKAHCAPLVPRGRGAGPRARPAHPGRRSRPEGARGGGSKPRASHLFRRRTSHHRSARAHGSRKRRRSAQRGRGGE